MTGENTAPLFEGLEVMDDRVPHGGAFNMALDEVLLQSLSETPLLRIYRWAHAAVSFGYFEAWEPLASEYPSGELVRRWTGGGVVEHGQDVTYSLLLPRTHLLTNLAAGVSYQFIHARLLRAMNVMGCANVEVSDGASYHPASRACFAKPVRYDLLSNGQKISGAAQRRTRRGLLHQGRIQNLGGHSISPELLAEVLPPTLNCPLESMARRNGCGGDDPQRLRGRTRRRFDRGVMTNAAGAVR